MKRIILSAVILLVIAFNSKTISQTNVDMATQGTRPPSYVLMEKVYENGDTIFVETLRTIYVFPPLAFKSKKQEKFYWRTVRDVKKALPYARLASMEIDKLNKELFLLPDDATRKKRIKQFQKQIFKQYEKPLRNLTVNQGKMLIKLIDREHDMNTFELIKSYKGGVPAVFWNTIAKFFGSDLKSEYDGSDKDRIVERVVILVDAGQL